MLTVVGEPLLHAYCNVSEAFAKLLASPHLSSQIRFGLALHKRNNFAGLLVASFLIIVLPLQPFSHERSVALDQVHHRAMSVPALFRFRQ